MNRKTFLLLLTVFVAFPLFAKEAIAAPHQGSVFVRTSYEGGAPAPYQSISIQKLQGNYPVPPGRYVTNGVGQIWIALYPGVYRFRVKGAVTTPTYWDVSVSSRGEYYIFFTLASQEE